MRYSGRKSAGVLAGLFMGLFLFATQGRGEMIQAAVTPQKGETQQQCVERVKKKMLQDTLYKKALGVLPGKVPATREKALRSLLASRQKQFIRAVEVLDPGASDGLLVMDVQIDENKLLKTLRLSGIYYTLAQKRPFQLDLQGASPEEKQQLDALMAESGLVPGVDVLPTLTLIKEQGVWVASLNTGYGQFSEQGKQLGPLWARLWEHYFDSLAAPKKEAAAAPENAEKQKQTLIIRGFSSPDKVYVLDAVFGKWKSLVAKYKIQKIDMNTFGIEAAWDIEVLNQKAFADRLTNYIANSNLSFGWDGME